MVDPITLDVCDDIRGRRVLRNMEKLGISLTQVRVVEAAAHGEAIVATAKALASASVNGAMPSAVPSEVWKRSRLVIEVAFGCLPQEHFKAMPICHPSRRLFALSSHNP
jgi:hypothetical protein